MESLRVQDLIIETMTIPTRTQIPGILEYGQEGTLCMMTGMVTTKIGEDQDILAVITEHITTTHQSNIIADTVGPSTSTDSLMIGGSTGVLDRADTTRTSTDTVQVTVRTDTENKNRWVENNTTQGTIRTIRGIVRSTNYLFSAH